MLERAWLRNEGNQPDVATTPRALKRKLLAHPSHEFGPSDPRGVVRAGLVTRICVAASFRGMTVAPMPAGRGVLPLADIPDCQRRDGPPQLVIRGKDPVVAVPVLPRRWDKVRQTIEELKRRELDDAIGPRPRGLAAAAGPDPVGGLVSGEHVADFGCVAACVAGHGESFEREGGPGAVSEKVLALASMGCDRSTPRLPSGLPARHAA